MYLNQLTKTEYAPYFSTYIKHLEDVHLIEELEISVHEFVRFVQNIPLDKFDYRYAPDKWTIKDIIIHLIDVERIFSYRALRIARNDKTPLASFDEDNYVVNANANNRSIQSLLSEFLIVRESTLALFKSFSEEQMMNIGTASSTEISARALGFIIIGHQKHHQKVFQERYIDEI